MPIPSFLKPFFTTRFLKFGVVGASGVVVNLGALAIFRGFDLTSTLASALAIEVSILSNFLINDRWTFADQAASEGGLARAARFQAVSLVGAVIQWAVFIVANIGALRLLQGSAGLDAWWATAEAGALTWVVHPITHPPEVGAWIYPAQLLGIAVATGWNFLANFRWTWRLGPGSAPQG